MGYELELEVQPVRAAAAAAEATIETRWQRAQRRLEAALAQRAALRERTAQDAPERIAAELSVAQARLRCREIEEALYAD
jgi:hypothetical protein